MTTPKLTPWFVNGEKPARTGVYNVSCKRSGQSGMWYARWNGGKWFAFARSIPDANREDCESAFMGYGSWRGLAEKPE